MAFFYTKDKHFSHKLLFFFLHIPFFTNDFYYLCSAKSFGRVQPYFITTNNGDLQNEKDQIHVYLGCPANSKCWLDGLF